LGEWRFTCDTRTLCGVRKSKRVDGRCGSDPSNPPKNNHEPRFTAAQLEKLDHAARQSFESLNAETLTAALDPFDVSDFGPAARLWQEIADCKRLIMTVKPKRKESIALLP
jgi:hypothetical protein